MIDQFSVEEMYSCDSDDDSVEQKNINLVQLIEVFIAGTLIFVLKVSGDNWLYFPANLFNHHVVFLVGNVIIVVCYVLSRGNEKSGNNSEKYSERYSSSSYRKTSGDVLIGEPVTVTLPPKETQAPEETSGEDNYEIDGVETESETASEVAINQAVKQIERFRRTQSEKLKREMSIKHHRKMRRSATAGRSRLLVTSSGERSPVMSSETVEKMSNEEFQLAVETFISKQQSFLKQEGMAESGNKL